MRFVSLHSDKPDPKDLAKTELTYPGYEWFRTADDDWEDFTRFGQWSGVRNRVPVRFPDILDVGSWRISYLSVSDDDRCVALVKLNGEPTIYGPTGLMFHTRAIEIGPSELLAPWTLSKDSPPPSSTLTWRSWRHDATHPGECPCGVPRAVCDYHRG